MRFVYQFVLVITPIQISGGPIGIRIWDMNVNVAECVRE